MRQLIKIVESHVKHNYELDIHLLIEKGYATKHFYTTTNEFGNIVYGCILEDLRLYSRRADKCDC